MAGDRRYSVKTPNALILVLGLLLSPCLAQASPPADEVTRVVRAEMASQQIPGLALLVARNGAPIRSEGYGLANVELNVPVKPETVFQSGSIGKQFTAAAVLMLADAGKIGLDDPLSKYFASAPGWWNEVTIRELLSHTAGFTGYVHGAHCQ
jgi:CubicO group peptidase (beta-lactamase class C family)